MPVITETLGTRAESARARIQEATERASAYDAKAAALHAQWQELRRDAAQARAQIGALAAYCEAADAVPVAERSLADAEERFAAAASRHSESETRCLQAGQLVRLAGDALGRAGGSRAQPAELVDLDQRLASARAVHEHEQAAFEEARIKMLTARAPIGARRQQVAEARDEAERRWKVAEKPPQVRLPDDTRNDIMRGLAERLSAQGFGAGRGSY